MSELDLVRYACIAHQHEEQDSSKSTTILAEFNSADSSLQTLAHQCLEKAPPHHSMFSHTYKNQTYTFLFDDHFVYFGIFDPKMGKPDQIRFLGGLKEALNGLVKLNPNKKLTPHCFQGELHPIFTKMAEKSPSLEPLDVSPPNVTDPDHNHNSMPGVSGSVSPSSRGRKIFSMPCKMGKGFKKKRPSGESEEALVNGKVGAAALEVDEVKSRKSACQNGLYLNEAGGGCNGGRQKAKKIWRRHVWIVLGLDLAVCLILFGIWLFVCRGFECIER